ncbi:MAG: CAP domain-containing protein [Lachnospiraceae bacterium]|nr:CAP domain-containing protein [Lachnospiraceae bacterium]
MKKKTRVLSIALAVLLVPVCACIIYISGGGKGVDDAIAHRTSNDISSDSVIYLDDEAIALADTSDDSTSLRSEALRAFNLVNSQRTSNGLDALVWDDRLESTAAVRAKEISRSFSHTRPDGRAWYTVNSAIMGGENLAYGYYDASSALNAWMDSPTHRENILWPDFTSIAISIYVADDGTYYWAQEFGY